MYIADYIFLMDGVAGDRISPVFRRIHDSCQNNLIGKKALTGSIVRGLPACCRNIFSEYIFCLHCEPPFKYSFGILIAAAKNVIVGS